MDITNLDNLSRNVLRGDISSFESLYKDMQPRLFAFCCKFIDDRDLVRDFVQDVFLTVWNSRQTLIIHTSLSSYIYKMAYYRCLNHLRQQKADKKYQNYAALKIKEAELIFFDPEYNSKGSIYFTEIETILEKTIANLPEQCRNIFIMSRVDGLENKAIAEKLNLSVRTVESQIYKALKILKTELKDYYYVLIPYLAFFIK
jgi:RNA polymerase sigma-70 factor, ECF subfamily